MYEILKLFVSFGIFMVTFIALIVKIISEILKNK